MLAGVSHAVLTLEEVRESGLPAFFVDFGESLLYERGQLFELRDREAWRPEGLSRRPLPAEVLAGGVGIDYGWRHAARCACRYCSRWASSEDFPRHRLTPASFARRAARIASAHHESWRAQGFLARLAYLEDAVQTRCRDDPRGMLPGGQTTRSSHDLRGADLRRRADEHAEGRGVHEGHLREVDDHAPAAFVQGAAERTLELGTGVEVELAARRHHGSRPQAACSARRESRSGRP